MPGLVSQALVFIFLPHIISRLNVVSPKYNFAAATISRLLLVLDPKLTFQAMEVRPYSVMPFIWMVMIFIISSLLKLDNRRISPIVTFQTIAIFLLTLLLFWFHSVSAIITISIYTFFIIKQKENFFKNVITKKSLSLLIVCIIFSLPIWNYFSSNNCRFCERNNYNILVTSITSLQEIYAINKGAFNDIKIQNILYFISLCIMLGLTVYETSTFLINRLHKKVRIKNTFFIINLPLVILPLIIIFLSDYLSHYGFWLRQFSWVMVPFYISISSVLSQINYNKIIHKIR